MIVRPKPLMITAVAIFSTTSLGGSFQPADEAGALCLGQAETRDVILREPALLERSEDEFLTLGADECEAAWRVVSNGLHDGSSFLQTQRAGMVGPMHKLGSGGIADSAKPWSGAAKPRPCSLWFAPGNTCSPSGGCLN